jgi:glycosyltransferase involved in cell wall biosynthesis
MKKLLFITAFPPNNKSGGQVFSLNLIKDLSEYTVDLIYFTYKDHEIAPDLPVNSVKAFAVDNRNCLRNIRTHPIFTRRFNQHILRYIADAASGYDILFFDYTQVGLYSLYLNHPYKVIRCHDILFQKFSRKDRIFRSWIKSTEEKILGSAKKIFVLSEKDANIVRTVYNFIAYPSNAAYIKDFHFSAILNNSATFTFFGLWSRKENMDGLIWFIKNALPLINGNFKIKFVIIGGGLPEKIRRKYILPYNNIEYAGFVDEPLDMIYQSRALIAPLFTGAGVKVKVIDAFTTGTPVIGTDITFEGLPLIEGLTWLAHTPQEYAGVINKLLPLSPADKQAKARIFKTIYDSHHLPEYL